MARYLPLDVAEVRDALSEGESRRRVIDAGVEALNEALTTRKDTSGTTMMGRVREFLAFANELAECGRREPLEGEVDDEGRDPLAEYIGAVGVYEAAEQDRR